MKTFQTTFIERLETEANALGFDLVAQYRASNVVRIDFCPIEEGFTSVLVMDASFNTNHNVFEWNNAIMTGDANPRMEIVKENVSAADVVIDNILKFLSRI